MFLNTSKKQLFFLILIVLTLFSFSSDPYSVKRISDGEFRYEFYTVTREVNIKANRTYYWFKGGAIHNSESGVVGEVLNDKFIKLFHSNQLAEYGFFKKGLKVGEWKTWHENGKLETVTHWRNGLKNGNFVSFNQDGDMIEKRDYENDRKCGIWINYVKKDTVYYKNDKEYVKKVKEKPIKLKEPKKSKKQKENSNRLEVSQKTLSNSKVQDTIKKVGFLKKMFQKRKND